MLRLRPRRSAQRISPLTGGCERHGRVRTAWRSSPRQAWALLKRVVRHDCRCASQDGEAFLRCKMWNGVLGLRKQQL